MMYRPFAVHQ